MRIQKRKFLALICLILLSFAGIAQNNGNGNDNGNGVGSDPPPPIPPPPPGLPIDGAIPVALVLAAYFGIKKTIEINK